MKLTVLLLTAALLQVHARGISQTVTLKGKDVGLKSIFSVIKKQTGYVAFYNRNLLEEAKPVSFDVQDMPLDKFLSLILKDQPLSFRIADRTILLARKAVVAPSEQALPPAGEQSDAEGPGYRGKIVNDQGKSLEDAFVMIKGTHHGVYTDRNGVFSIDGVTVGTELVISYTGYTPVTYTVKSLARSAALEKILPAGVSIYVMLQPNKNSMDEMQVIAYGKVSKRFNTGDVTTIKAEEIARNPVSNVLEVLQGRVPGMQIVQATGNPGSNFGVQIRGISTFAANAQPLFVVDGVVYPSGSIPLINPTLNGYVSDRNNGYLNGGNALNYLNPDQIESVEVLKDADATSIYGSRGSYGVVLITTKKGKVGVPRLNVNTYSGITQRGVSPKLLNTQQYLALRREALLNDNSTVGTDDYDLNGTWDTTRYVDWNKALVGHGTTNTVNMTYSGGVGMTSYLLAGNYTRLGSINDHGGAQNSGGINFNINTGSASQKLTASISGSFSTTINDQLPVDFIGLGALIAPNHPDFILPDGKLDWDNAVANGRTLPQSQWNLYYHGVTNNLTGTTILKYNPLPGLTLNASLGFNLLTTREVSAIPGSSLNPLVYNPPGDFANSRLANSSSSTVNFDPYANYNRRLGSKGRLDVTAGMDMQSTQANSNTINGVGYPTDATVKDPALGKTVSSTYTTTPTRQLGYFGRINYIWDQKYILNLSGRYDGSTKFAPGKQFGAFGAIGAAWLFSEENWIKDNLRFLSFGKLRGSYGTTGGDGIGNYQFLSTYSVTNNGYQGGLNIASNGLSNPYLQWELNKKKELGLELRFLKDRIAVEGSYYVNRTNNQLVGMPLSIVTGFGAITQNSPALIQNAGFESQLITVNVESKNFSWKTMFNISVNRNKLVAYPGATANSVIRQNPNYVLGKSLQNLKLYNYAGVDPATGVYFFTNAKGVTGSFEPLFTAGLDPNTDKTKSVDFQPSYFGGIENTLTYKGFMLDFFFSFIKEKGLNYEGQQTFIPGQFNMNPTTAWLHRWQKPGDVAPLPGVSANGFNALFLQQNFTQSSGAYGDASYARLQNVYISYTFQPAFLKRSKITALTVYLKGQNLLTISHYGTLDPENLSASSTGPLRVYTGGLNITL